MKITISENHLAEIKKLRKQLTAVLGTQTTATAEYERLLKKQATLQGEIAELEDSESDSAAASLSTKREQLKAVERKITAIEGTPASDSVREQAEIGNLLKQFARSAAAATGADCEAYARNVAALIREHCKDELTAYGLALQTSAVISLFQKCTWPYGTYSAGVKEIKKAIAHADEILAGELVWSFDPKIKA
ncbi:MAG: hypothetical protein P4N60_18510 [Verrucomicrobiae bacterium]|nr:hypothetical protein [Verrucomicrobiae bacterium]